MTPQHFEVIDTRTIRPFKYPRLAHNGYLYHFHKKCTHHLRWKCNRVYSLKCPAVLRTNINYEQGHIVVDHEHVHGYDFIAIEALKTRINVVKQSSLFNKNTCFKPNNLDTFFEEIDLPETIKNNSVRFCASSKEIFLTDPLDLDYKNGNTEKYEEIMKNDNSIDTFFNFENYPFNKLELKDNKNQILVNLKDGAVKNHTSYSFDEELKNVNQICWATSPNKHNMTINNKQNNTQQNKRALLTNTHKKKNTSTTNTYKKISNFTTNTRKVKNSLITNIKKKNYTLTNNKFSLRNYKNKRNRKNVKTTNKQKHKSTLITNACRQIISSKVKLRKYTSKFTNQNSPIIINTNTTTSTSTIKSTPTIISTSKMLSTPTIESAAEIISTPTVNSLPSIKITHNMIERRLKKNINNKNESISDNDDDNNSFGFVDTNYNAVYNDDDEETNIKIKKLKLVQEDYMYHILYNKKNWSTILKKLSDPSTGIKVFENILLIKVLIRIMKGNNETKSQVRMLKNRNDHWKLKFDCLKHKIKILVNSTRSDRNMRRTSVINEKAKDTTLCTNIEVQKQENNFGLKKKVSTELKSNVTLENSKNSKLYQYFNRQNNFLSKYGSDIRTRKSKEVKTKIPSIPLIVDLLKDIPANVMISRLSPKPFDTKQNNLTQSDSDIKMIESNENFSPVSCISKDLKLSPKSLKRKISNLIQNNTSIEIKSKFRKYNELSSLASNDLIMESPDIMVSRFGPKLLNSQITNSTQYNTAIKMTESDMNKYYESLTSASVDAIVKNLPLIINSRLIGENNISTQFNKHTEIIPSISISNDFNSDVPTSSSSSMKSVTSLNENLLFNKEFNSALSMVSPSNVEILVFEKNLEFSTKDSKIINYKEWKSPRKLTVPSETDPSMDSTVILPFALKRLSKLNNHSPSQYPMLNKLLTKPNITMQLDKRDKLNTPLIPVQMNTPLPDVVYESTQIMNEINFKETIHQKPPNQIKSVPKAIPLPPPEIINDFSNKV